MNKQLCDKNSIFFLLLIANCKQNKKCINNILKNNQYFIENCIKKKTYKNN